MAAQDTGNLAKLLHDYFNKRAFDETSKLVADNAQVIDIPSGQVWRGAKGHQEFQQGWVTAFPDARTEITHVCASADSAVVEFRGRGTHKGVLKTASGEFAATGKKLDLPFCEVYGFKNGKVTEVRIYYDTASMARQLGLTLPGR
jgi:steroid delta-isomerase-like uncharacterized protein